MTAGLLPRLGTTASSWPPDRNPVNGSAAVSPARLPADPVSGPAATQSRAWGSHSESSRIPWTEKDRDDDGDACV